MNFRRPLILGSSSPRRKFLMEQAGFKFAVASPDIDESFPSDMAVEEIPKYLAARKARVFEATLDTGVVVTSDTVVILGREVLNKPADRDEAIAMLSRLSGQTHNVITAVCLLDRNKMDCFDDRSRVRFKRLSRMEIEYYVDTFKPFDKAGAYGAQDCLPEGLNPCAPEEMEFLTRIGKLDLIDQSIRRGTGITIIENIDGAYFTVMGLPLHKVYEHLEKF